MTFDASRLYDESMGFDPSRMYDEAGGTRVIWPSDLREEFSRVDAKMLAVNQDMANALKANCIKVETAQDFSNFYWSWRKFYCDTQDESQANCTEPSFSYFGMGSTKDEIEAFEGQLYQWQQMLAANHCNLSEPLGPPPTPTSQQPSDVTSWTKYAVIGLGIIAGMYVAQQTGVLRRFRK